MSFGGLDAGDANGDGTLDLFVANLAGISVLLGNGDGTFQNPVTSGGSFFQPSSLAVADYNEDGIADVVLCEYQKIKTCNRLLPIVVFRCGLLRDILLMHRLLFSISKEQSVFCVLPSGCVRQPKSPARLG
jgi:hypothetical protein